MSNDRKPVSVEYARLAWENFPEATLDPNTRVEVAMGGRVTCRQGKWEVGPRIIADHLVYFAESGRLDARIGEVATTLGPGDFLWAQPGAEQCFRIPRGTDATVVLFARFHLERNGRVLRARENFLRLPGLEILRHLTLAVARERQRKPDAAGTRLMVGALAQTAIDAAKNADAPSQGLKPHIAERVVGYIRERREARVTLRELAREAGMNPAYFAERFKNHFGVSPRAYLVKARIDLAEQLLRETRMNVSEVADYLGYSDPFLFSRQFKRLKGTSPSQWKTR